MKKAVKKNILVIAVFAFLLVQPVLTYIYNPDFFSKLPEITWNGLRTGEYGTKLEKTLNDESFFAKVSNEQYRLMLYKFFYRLNDNVIIGKKDFLFLPKHTNEIGPDEFEKDIPKLLKSINGFKKYLDEKGIPLMVAVLPSRAKVFPEYAYKNKTVPKNRKEYFEKVFEAFEREGISYYRLDKDLIELKSKMKRPPFYKVDHHWTFEAVEKIAPKFISGWEALHGPLVPKPIYKKVYDYKWEKVINEYNNIVHKLGFSRGSVPVKYKEVQLDPKFTPEKHIEKTDGRLMLLSSSYGGYGVVEFLSNELGYKMPFYVVHGQSVKYMASQFIYRNINYPEKYGTPKGVIWLMSEGNIVEDMLNDLAYPQPIGEDFLGQPLKFEISEVVGGKLDKNVLTQNENTMKFSIKTSKPAARIVLRVKHDSGRDYSQSILKVLGKQFLIVHDGKENDIPLEIHGSKNLDISIESSRLKSMRDFNIQILK